MGAAGIGSRMEVRTNDGEAKSGTVSEKTEEGVFKVTFDKEGRDTDLFAMCPEELQTIRVSFPAGISVGSEIPEFVIDKKCPLTPIRIGSMAGEGPAQEAGVRGGWFLDLQGTLFGPS